jgi:hypothetical protein
MPAPPIVSPAEVFVRRYGIRVLLGPRLTRLATLPHYLFIDGQHFPTSIRLSAIRSVGFYFFCLIRVTGQSRSDSQPGWSKCRYGERERGWCSHLSPLPSERHPCPSRTPHIARSAGQSGMSHPTWPLSASPQGLHLNLRPGSEHAAMRPCPHLHIGSRRPGRSEASPTCIPMLGQSVLL